MSGLELKYFVLKPHGTDYYAAASRAAMMEYAEVVRVENPQLADDLAAWAEREYIATEDARLAEFEKTK